MYALKCRLYFLIIYNVPIFCATCAPPDIDSAILEDMQRQISALWLEQQQREISAQGSAFPSPMKYPYFPRDGVPSGDVFLVPRKLLREVIVKQLITNGRLLISAPPGSGKTTIAGLLMRENFQGKKSLYVAANLPDSMDPMLWLLEQAHAKCKEIRTLIDAIQYFDFIIIDDAQKLYKFNHFWQAIIKLKCNDPAFKTEASILFFASYSIEGVEGDSPAIPFKVLFLCIFRLCI